jgi:hypothetical protein
MTGDARCRGGARRDAQSRARSPDVRVHTRLRDAQLRRDLLRRQTPRDGTQDLSLPVGERVIRCAAVEDAPGERVASDKTEKE